MSIARNILQMELDRFDEAIKAHELTDQDEKLRRMKENRDKIKAAINLIP